MQKKSFLNSRRQFLKTTGKATVALSALAASSRFVHAAHSDELTIGLIGCGGRGSGGASTLVFPAGDLPRETVESALAAHPLLSILAWPSRLYREPPMAPEALVDGRGRHLSQIRTASRT